MPTNTDKLASRTISKDAIAAAPSTTKDYRRFWAGPPAQLAPGSLTYVPNKGTIGPDSPPPIVYHRYPMYLKHASLDPVIVYDETQETEYRAKGFAPPGSPDPHGYLVSKVSDKLDDAIRAMNERVETKIRDGLRDLYTKMVEMFHAEMRLGRLPLAGDMSDEITNEATKTTVDIMSAVREIAKSSRRAN